MSAETVFNNIVQQVQSSNLNFMIQLSPFAANISLKKSPLKDKSGIPFPLRSVSSPPPPSRDELETLAAKNKQLEMDLLKIKNKYAEAMDECESNREMVKHLEAKVQVKPELTIHQHHLNLNELYEEIGNLLQENKELKITIENKDDEIGDLEKVIKTRKEVFDILNKDFKDLRVKFGKEKAQLINDHKA